jgi:threonine synthase
MVPQKTIRDIYDRCDHLIDTHTAVGFNVYSRYAGRSGDDSKVIFVSTASPFKFSARLVMLSMVRATVKAVVKLS